MGSAAPRLKRRGLIALFAGAAIPPAAPAAMAAMAAPSDASGGGKIASLVACRGGIGADRDATRPATVFGMHGDNWRTTFGLPCLVLAFVAAHLLLLDLPLVNWEFSFSDAARYFSSGDVRYLEQYFDHEANTLAVPWMAFAVRHLFPGLAVDCVPRLLSALGIPFLAYGLIRMNRQLAQAVNPHLLLAIVLLNPLVWTFAGRGTADFLPAAIAVFGLSLFWNRDETGGADWRRQMLASAILGLAAVIKYHALLLLAGVVAEIVARRKGQYRHMLAEGAVSLAPAILVLAGYLLTVKIAFGFWLVPPGLLHRHGLNLAAGPDNFVSYAGYLVLITVPLSLALPWRGGGGGGRDWRYGAGFLFVVFAFALGYLFLSDNGEMNLGPMDPYVDKHMVNGVVAAAGALLAVRLAMGLDGATLKAKAASRSIGLAAAIVFFILALSVTRPAQRYLLFVIPLFYLFLLRPYKYRRTIVACAIALSVTLDVYILLNQAATGIASQEMAQRIAALGLMAKTDPGPIDGNVGDRFFRYRGEQKAFAVVAGDVAGSIARVRYSPLPRVPFLGRTYSLVRRQSPSSAAAPRE